MKIEQIKPSQRVKGRYLVSLEDGSLLRMGEEEILSFSLYAGRELSDEELEQLAHAAQRAQLKEKAYSVVSYKPVSRGELVDKLERLAPDCAEDICAIVDRMEELGLINDLEYAKTVARHYSKKGYGLRRLRDEFYKRRIPKELWDEALEEAVAPEEGVDALIRKRLRGVEEPERADYQRVSNALARRGFSWEEIKEGIERYQRENS